MILDKPLNTFARRVLLGAGGPAWSIAAFLFICLLVGGINLWVLGMGSSREVRVKPA